jgi:hypothetical protein
MDDIGFGCGFRPGPHPGEGGVGYVLEKAEVVRQMVRSKPFEEPSDEQLTKDRAAIAAMKATVRDA